jgi:hypothetical protein
MNSLFGVQMYNSKFQIMRPIKMQSRDVRLFAKER